MKIEDIHGNVKSGVFSLITLHLLWGIIKPDWIIPGLRPLAHVPTALLGILFLCWLLSDYKAENSRQFKYCVAFWCIGILQIFIARNGFWAYKWWEGFTQYLIYFLVLNTFVNNFARFKKFIVFFFS